MVATVQYGEDALNSLEQLATENANLGAVIRTLGQQILQMPEVGMRVQEEGRTYDAAFVRTRGNRTLAFVSFITPMFRGSMTPTPPPDRLRVRVRVNPERPINGGSWFINPSWFPSGGGGGWHDGFVYEGGRELDIATRIILEAFQSWD